MNCVIRVSHLTLVLGCLFMAGCPECDNLPDPSNGPNGERVSFSQLMSDAAVPGSGLEGRSTCTFNVDFTVERLVQPATAQLLVEICKDAAGNDFEANPFPQIGTVRLTPGQQTGSLAGTLGPPVSDKVRFNLAIELFDSTGRSIAHSEHVRNLRPQ